MQSRIDGDRLSVAEDEAEKIIRYVNDYGEGGFQARLRPLAERLRVSLEHATDP